MFELCKLLRYDGKLRILKNGEILNWGLPANHVCVRLWGRAPGYRVIGAV